MAKPVEYGGKLRSQPASLNERDITVPRLRRMLTAAVIDSKIDGDGDLYIHDGVAFPLWLSINRDRKLLQFQTYLKTTTMDAQLLTSRIHAINTDHMLVKFLYRDEAFWGYFWMTYDGGLSPRQMVKMLRFFAECFWGAVIGNEDLFQHELVEV